MTGEREPQVSLRDDPLFGIELGPKMQACDPRERIFAFAVGVMGMSNAEAARRAGYPDPGPHSNSANAHGHRISHRERVIKAIEEVSRSRFRNLVPQVISAAQAVLNDPKHKHHVPLIISLLGRMGYAEKAAVEVNVSGEIVVDHTAQALEDLRLMKELGVSREKLLRPLSD
jgi:hypothetical protein